jgi:hypothetical protein
MHLQQLPPGGRTLVHNGVTYVLTPELYASGLTKRMISWLMQEQ